MSEHAIHLVEVTKTYRAASDYLGLRPVHVPAVRGVSLSVRTGGAFGVVGESGSGKSTLARLIAGLEPPDAGRVEVCGLPVPRTRDKAWQQLRRRIQVVFQDPYSALDLLMTVGDSIAEPLRNLMPGLPRAEREGQVMAALAAVQLPGRMFALHPHQLSGGERQRVCIARALVLRPDVVICDEAVSALDAETQVQIVQLLRDLQQSHRLTYFFISHDIAVVSRLCDEVAVMQQGVVVETGPCRQVLTRPDHPYTRSLVDAAMYFQRGRLRP